MTPATTVTREQKRLPRRFRRRRLRLPALLRTDNGKSVGGEALDIGLGGLRLSSTDALHLGDSGFVHLTLEDGQKLKLPVDVVWHGVAVDGMSLYGLRCRNLSPAERSALLEAIYAHPADATAATFESPDGATVEASPLPQAHHVYYMRLIRRIEQVHSLTPADTDRLLFARLQEAKPLRDVLVDAGLTTDDDYESFLSAVYDLPYIDLNRNRPDPGAADAIPLSIATSHNILPVKRTAGKLVVAMADPLDLPALDMLAMRSKDRMDIRFALLEEVESAVKDLYHGTSLHSVDRLFEKVGSKDENTPDIIGDGPDVEDLEALRKLTDATPIVTVVDSMLRSAVEDRASDVHLEPFADSLVVRFRLDGMLRQMRTLPKNISAGVVSRIKIMARMDITVRHIPQDGRASMRYQRKDFDLRISSMPTVFGEKIVIRLLEKNPTRKTISSIGFDPHNYDLFLPLVRRPHGMILCCGPTGSGKSTTLFACLQDINDGTTNITTIEDPVEYRVPGVNQVEVNTKRGLTFAAVLRSLLRQDPDTIYVGEIRDRETADLAVRAALTGHLLLSTLHTNTAVQAIARLVDIGVDPALIGSSLAGVVGQRLVRKICDRCKEEYAVPPEELLVIQDLMPSAAPEKLWRGKGCNRCHGTGYYGRMAVHEVIVIDDTLRRLIAKGADSTQLLDYVTQRGFRDLRADAVQRLLAGDTTVREVMRVTV